MVNLSITNTSKFYSSRQEDGDRHIEGKSSPPGGFHRLEFVLEEFFQNNKKPECHKTKCQHSTRPKKEKEKIKPINKLYQIPQFLFYRTKNASAETS